MNALAATELETSGEDPTAASAAVDAAIARRNGSPSAPVIALREATVSGSRGPAFGPITAESDRGLTVVVGPHASGRTSLLLSIAGRMRLSGGGLEVLGERSTATIRALTGIAGFAEIDALEPVVTVGATLRERLGWASPWYRRSPRITPELAREIIEPVCGGHAIDVDALVRELTPAEDLLLRVSLALIEDPRLLVIDDFDALRDPAERAFAADRIARLVERGLRVVIATSDPGDAALFAELSPAIIAL